MTIRAGDSQQQRKQRGAFFTPPAIAEYLARWAVLEEPNAKILDPTCGEAVFLLAAGRQLKELGREVEEIGQQLYGFDLHDTSLEWANRLLGMEGLDATLKRADFFSVPTPDQLLSNTPWMDAIIGNPPFVRYQRHIGESRDRSKQAALQQGVRLSNMASSWAALLIHACGFLKPEGRLAMVLPAELLTVAYAEPVREWLKRRFGQVHLVMFDKLQFDDAVEKVVLVLASGTGGCDAFSLYYLDSAEDLAQVRPMSNHAAPVLDGGKWTHLFLSNKQRTAFRSVTTEKFECLAQYGVLELGTVTGANSFFTLNEDTRTHYGLEEKAGQLTRICPPGTKHFKGLAFTARDWRNLRDAGERVWLFRPDPNDNSRAVMDYVAEGERLGVDAAYKCTIRTPWWRPPAVTPPDLYFTYMSHRYPRVIENSAGTTFLNSMHGIRLRSGASSETKRALPLIVFNSVTMLGAEVFGRSYGGGVLKMEPSEAALLPVPRHTDLVAAWDRLEPQRAALRRQLLRGEWTNVVKTVDDALLVRTLGLDREQVSELHEGARELRARRMGKRAGE
jgi:tRNA1(Val) A37 N6-methylase TrmN6